MSKPTPPARGIGWLLVALVLSGSGVCAQDPDLPPPPPPQWPERLERSPSRLTDEVMPVREGAVPTRPTPLLELGNAFLDTGPIFEGFEIPTGAVWQPQLMVYGTLRSGLQTQRVRDRTTTEWANRLDLFANLELTKTERFVFGIRPLDREAHPFSGYVFAPDEDEGWQNGFDAHIEALFFEADLGELFPNWDFSDQGRTDIGFSVGRQPIRRQEGLLIDDTLDSIGLTQNTLRPEGMSNLLITGLYAWSEVNRGNNTEDPEAQLFAVFTTIDMPVWTIEADLVWVDSDSSGGDSLHAAVGAVRRLGNWSMSARALASLAIGASTPRANDGFLLFNEWSLTPHKTEDLLYVNAYAALGDFTSAARAPDIGGTLGRVGILWSAIGLGRQESPLPNDARRSFGAALGHQWQFEDHSQVILEGGGRLGFGPGNQHAAAVGGRFQHPFGQRYIVQIDSYVAHIERDGFGFGARLELIMKF